MDDTINLAKRRSSAFIKINERSTESQPDKSKEKRLSGSQNIINIDIQAGDSAPSDIFDPRTRQKRRSIVR